MGIVFNPFTGQFDITGTGGGGGGAVDSVNGQTGVVQLDAVDIPYDNTASGLAATDTQAAIDEVVSDLNAPKRIIYADANFGNDITGTGSYNSPVQTLQKAVTLVINPLVGYLIRLAPGDYNGAPVAWPPNADLQGSGANDTSVGATVTYIAAAASSTAFNMSMISMNDLQFDFTLAGIALPTLYDGSFKVTRTDTLTAGPWAIRVNDSSMGDCIFNGNNLLSNVLFVSNIAVNSGALYCSDTIIGVTVDVTYPAALGLTGCTVSGTLNGIPGVGNPQLISDAGSLAFATITGTFDITYSDKAFFVEYDNTSSGLTATNVQDAIDEVAASATPLTFTAPLVETLGVVEINGQVEDSKLKFEATADPTKVFAFDLSGMTTGTTATLKPLNTATTSYQIRPNVDTTANIITQNATSGQVFIGADASIGGANSGIQYSNATTANRGQIRLGSYVNATSVAGVTTATSRSGTVGVNAAVVAGQDYSKWTAQAGATTAGSLPISGAFAFKANTVNSLTVTSDYHIQLTNLAGVLGDRLYLGSEGALQLPHYTAGLATFDASGNVTSDPSVYVKADGSVPMTGDLNMNTHFITNVVDPVNPQDAATKAYVDASSGGGSPISQALVSATYTPTTITGAAINPVTARSFEMDYIIKRKYTGAETPGGDIDTGIVQNMLYTPIDNGNLNGVIVDASSNMVVVGSFTEIGSNTGLGRIARFNNSGVFDTTFTGPGTGANDVISHIKMNNSSGNDYWIGGNFTTYNGTAASRFAHLDINGNLDTTFATNLGTGFNNTVKTSCYANGTNQVVAAGTFTSFNGNTRNRIVLLNFNGTEDTTFATNIGTGANNQIHSVNMMGNQILVTGQFTQFNGVARNRIVLLNINGTVDTTFATNVGTAANNTISSVSYDDVNNKVLVAGQFSSFNGVSRPGLARLSNTGVPDTTFNSHIPSLFGSSTSTVFNNQGATYWMSNNGPIRYIDSMGYEDTRFSMDLAGAVSQNAFFTGGGGITVVGSMVEANSLVVNKLIRFSYLSTGQDINLYEKGTMAGYYNDEDTNFEYDIIHYIGQRSYNELSVDASGNVQYTSPNIIGTEVENSIRLLIKEL